MRQRRTYLGFASILFWAVACAAGPALGQVTLPTGYTFTPIVVGNPFTAPLSVGSSGALSLPGINNQGTVAFEANSQLVNGTYTEYGFYAGDGSGTQTPIITTSSIPNLTNDFVSINDSGFIGFIGCSGAATCAPPNGNGADTVYTSNGTVLNKLASSRWSAGALSFDNDVAINNAGSVTFQDPATGNIIKADPSGTKTVIAGAASGFQSLGQGSINNPGTVAFTGTDANGLSGIFAGNGTTVTTIAHSGGIFGQVINNFPPSINDSGTVALAAVNVPPNNGTNGVFTSDGTTVGIITTTTALGFEQVAINNSGVVAFIAGGLNGSAQAILVGAAGIAPQTVIQTGEALAGSTITNFVIGPNAINGVGQIAFWASLADGRTGVFRADPSGGVGSTPDNPVLPTAISKNGTFIIPLAPCLDGVHCHDGTIDYFDPPANVAGYNYSVDPTSSPFDAVVLPAGLGLGPNNNYYVLTLFNSHFKAYIPTLHVLTGGMPFHFATVGLTNLHNFGILGVNPAAHLDPTNVRAFPTGLTFMPGPIVGNLQMAPVRYPNILAGH
jgi:hypothetical protein